MTTMGAFQREARKTPIKPARVVLLRPTDFADDWKGRPSDDVAAGFRRLSETSLQGAQVEAAKRTRALCPEGTTDDDLVSAGNSALMCIVLGRALCDPNDLSRPHPLFPTAEDTLSDALTGGPHGGLRRLWNELELMTVETSPLQHEATDEEIVELGKDLMVEADQLHLLGPARACRLRRILGYVAEELDVLMQPEGA